MTDLFLALLQLSVGARDGLPRIPSPEEWNGLFDLAYRQAVDGICFTGVMRLLGVGDSAAGAVEPDRGSMAKLNLPEDLYYDWMGFMVQIQERNEAVNRHCVDLCAILKKKGLKFCIMKGQAVGRLYSSLAPFRQSGDIDVLMQGGRRKVLDLARSLADCSAVTRQHIHCHLFKDTEIEIHYVPAELHCPWYNRHLQRYFESLPEWQKGHTVETPAGVMDVPGSDFDIIHQLVHSFRHLFGDGIGFRQAMDLFFVLSEAQAGDRKPEWERLLSRLGILRFSRAMMYVLGKTFGLAEYLMVCSPDKEDGEYLLSEMLQAGDMGLHDSRIDKGPGKESPWHRYWRVSGQNLRLWRFSPWEVVWTPVWRVYNFFWEKGMNRAGRLACQAPSISS